MYAILKWYQSYKSQNFNLVIINYEAAFVTLKKEMSIERRNIKQLKL